ncbi:MAG TPA: phospholipase D-like domain-containing protein [Nitrospirota bacterium]|nr:phospholipase D-like domain-containing protein [Nitrospirota bacterium]
MTTIRLLKNGIEAFPSMYGAVDRATSCIAFEMYVFVDDDTGRQFREHLVNAARRGIRVMVLVDAWGSWALPDGFWDDLRAAGGMVRRFRPFSKGLFPFRDHRKLLLIDDSIAYVGGMNIADEYFRGSGEEEPWRDNTLEILGEEAIRLRRSFMKMWRLADSPLRTRLILRLRLRRDRGGQSLSGKGVRFLESGPENPLRPVRRAYQQVIQDSEKSIDLAMSYFYPHGRLMRAFKRAVKRGVHVRFLFPMKTDVPVARWAARGLYGRLLRAGAEVWEYKPTMMHAKLAIADDTVIAGSANLDIRSGKINYELVAVVTDPVLAAKARADFEDDLKRSVRINFEEWKKRPMLQKLKERFSFCLLARADIFVARMEMARKMR